MNGIYVIGSIINFSDNGEVYAGDLLEQGINVQELLTYIESRVNNIVLHEENGSYVMQCDHIRINVLLLDQAAADIIKMKIMSDSILNLKESVAEIKGRKKMMPLIYKPWGTFEELKQMPRYAYFEAYSNKRRYFTTDEMDQYIDANGVAGYCGAIHEGKLILGLEQALVIYNQLCLSVSDDHMLNLQLDAAYYEKYYAGDINAIENIFHSSVKTHVRNHNLSANTISYVMHIILGYYLKNIPLCVKCKHTFDVAIKDDELAIIITVDLVNAYTIYNGRPVSLMPSLGKIMINGVSMKYF